MTNPEDYKYTKDHEWIKKEGDVYIMGITSFAQEELGEVVYIDLPKVNTKVLKHASFCVVESTKAASDVYAPIGGTVVESNKVLNDSPSLINSSPFKEGWICKLTDINKEEFDSLLTSTDYESYLKSK